MKTNLVQKKMYKDYGSTFQMAELYKHYLKDIGLNSSIKVLERYLMKGRMETNKVDTRPN